MKLVKHIAIAAFLIVLPGISGVKNGQDIKMKQQEVLPFKVGEEVTYRVHYGLVNAGVATVAVKETSRVDGRLVYHMVGKGHTTGVTDWFFPTKDRYETFMDAETLLPLKFIRDVDEGGYIIKRNIKFDHEQNSAVDYELKKDTTFSLPDNVQDIFSAFFFARTFDVSNIQPGDIIDIPVFLDHEIFPFKIKFVKREEIDTKFGEIACLKFVPIVQEGRVFKEEDDMHLWISDDINHIPIRIKSEILVGSIKVDLKDYKGLVEPLKFK